MFKRFNTNYMVMLFLIDLILTQVGLQVAMQLRLTLPYGVNIDPSWPAGTVYYPTLGLHVGIALLWSLSFMLFALYTPRKVIFWLDELQRLFLAHSTVVAALAGILYLTKRELPRLTVLYFYLLVLTGLVVYRALLRVWHRLFQDKPSIVSQILIVGSGKMGRKVVAEFRQHRWPGIKLVGFLDDDPNKQGKQVAGLPVLGRCSEIEHIVSQYNIDEVFIALPRQAHARLNSLIAWLWPQPVRVRIVPDYTDLTFYGAKIQTFGSLTLVGLRDPAIDGFDRFVKRLIDILVSSVVLIFLLPVMVMVAIAVRIDSKGPIFYKSARVGENGQLFNMLKFRSMRVDADKMFSEITQVDEDGNLIHKSRHDPRVTRVGRFIRRTSLDELPQLINVLKGEMSLVGPRPELPWLVDKYDSWQRKRFAVPQGITGWWQVNGRGENLMHLSTDQDLHYIQNYSLWLDIVILWRTIRAVVRGKGAF